MATDIIPNTMNISLRGLVADGRKEKTFNLVPTQYTKMLASSRPDFSLDDSEDNDQDEKRLRATLSHHLTNEMF